MGSQVPFLAHAYDPGTVQAVSRFEKQTSFEFSDLHFL